MHNVLVFIIALLAPFVIIRTAIHLLMKRPHEATVVTIAGGRFHHLHLGILFVFAASLVLLFAGENLFSVGFLGLGLGLILDEFVASVIVPHQEPESTKLYLGSLKGTFVLLISVVVIILAFYLFLKFN
jgi:hypothetical protein